MTPTLKVAGIEISIIAWLNYNQEITPIGGSSLRRKANGSGFKLTHWRKWRIGISASGWIPPALNGIDYDAAFELELPRPLALKVGELLPAGMTSRAAPWDERSVTDQAGNAVRLVFPKMTVFAEPPSQSHGDDPAWELICETV